ncbi:hypothetical protein [Candidatus Laterigemmans baculatus]|uniref:hypothetical protein n=1 Tax=Candidatus Laterigemmans baculatus TaxID=2770505 RepID=UPI0013DB7FA5|nr:hypothetical protein [Candidatus Laterigemmans baculatus]
MQNLRVTFLMFSFAALIGFTGCAPEPETPPPAPEGAEVVPIPGDTALREGSVDASAGLPPEDQPAE